MMLIQLLRLALGVFPARTTVRIQMSDSVKALLTPQQISELKGAFDIFDEGRSGTIDSEDFQVRDVHHFLHIGCHCINDVNTHIGQVSSFSDVTQNVRPAFDRTRDITIITRD